MGELHAVNAPLSNRHSKTAIASGDMNENATFEPLVDPSAGPAVITVSGVDVSSTQVRRAGVASGLPALSTARTRTSCGPGTSATYICGEEQGVKVAASRAHSK